MAILDELRREFGLAMLFITHDLELAAAVCDRTAVMYAGQIVEIRGVRRCCTTTRCTPTPRRWPPPGPDIAPDGAPAARRSPAGRCRRSRRRDGCAFAPRCPHAQDACRAARARAGRARRRAVALRCARTSCAASCRGGAPCLSRRASTGPRGRGLRKEFGALVAVDDVVVRRSRRAGSLAIVGESGSGKTTIARMIVGLERPTGGHDHRLRARPVPARPARPGSAAAAAARCRSSSRTRTPASTRARPPRPPSTRCCGCTTAGRGRRRARVAELAELVGLDATPGPRPAALAVGRPAPAGRDRPRAGGRARAS